MSRRDSQHQSGLSYCGSQVRDHDKDRFLLSLLAPAQKRESLWALYAFNHEIAKTREVVTETTLGLIRLQWWRDAIAAIYDPEQTAPQHEIVTALEDAITVYDLPQDLFERLIYAREFDLEDVLPASLDGLAHYADYTATPLARLALKVLGDASDEGAAAISKACAVTGLLRAVPFHAAQRRCYLPADLMAKYGVREGDLYEGRLDEAGHHNLRTVIRQVADAAEQWLNNVDECPSSHLRWMHVMTVLYLKQLRRADGNVFDSRLRYRPGFFMPRLLAGYTKLKIKL